MSHSAFASSGVLDVPVPAWIATEDLFAQWGSFLMALIKHGSMETVRRSSTLTLSEDEFGLLIDGGLYATEQPQHEDARCLLIAFLERGDLFPASRDGHDLVLTSHGKSTCLVIREAALEGFKADFPSWELMSSRLISRMEQAQAQAHDEAEGRDQDRIRRVLKIMADHPTAIDSLQGREIEAGKQRIRDLAGVQKRSATRAFRALVEAGVVTFSGYKRLYFKG